MMDDKPQLIVGPIGQFYQQTSGIIYFEMRRNAVADTRWVQIFLDAVQRMDDSGSARVIVIQQGCQEPSPDARLLLFNNNVLAGLACIASTDAQKLSAERFIGFVKTHPPSFPVQMFQYPWEAEIWLLNLNSMPLS